MKAATIFILGAIAQGAQGFAPSSSTSIQNTQTIESKGTFLSGSSSTALNMANDEDLMRFARQSRSAGVDDRVVELKRPLGLVLNEDDNGNVFVETIAPKGNAARTGIVSFKGFEVRGL